MNNQKYLLISDVISNNKKTIYGKAGEEITLIEKMDDVAIVELKGERFSTLLLNLKEK